MKFFYSAECLITLFAEAWIIFILCAYEIAKVLKRWETVVIFLFI